MSLRRKCATAASVLLLAAVPAHSQPTGNRSPVSSPAELVARFKEICMVPGASAATAQAVFDRLKWRGRIAQRPSSRAPITHWVFSFGEANVGYRVIGGVDQRIDSCSLVIREEAAPKIEAIRAELHASFPKASFRDMPQLGGFRLEARLEDRRDAQARILLTGFRVPLSQSGQIELGRGVLLDYSHASGPYARLMEQ